MSSSKNDSSSSSFPSKSQYKIKFRLQVEKGEIYSLQLQIYSYQELKRQVEKIIEQNNIGYTHFLIKYEEEDENVIIQSQEDLEEMIEQLKDQGKNKIKLMLEEKITRPNIKNNFLKQQQESKCYINLKFNRKLEENKPIESELKEQKKENLKQVFFEQTAGKTKDEKYFKQNSSSPEFDSLNKLPLKGQYISFSPYQQQDKNLNNMIKVISSSSNSLKTLPKIEELEDQSILENFKQFIDINGKCQICKGQKQIQKNSEIIQCKKCNGQGIKQKSFNEIAIEIALKQYLPYLYRYNYIVNLNFKEEENLAKLQKQSSQRMFETINDTNLEMSCYKFQNHQSKSNVINDNPIFNITPVIQNDKKENNAQIIISPAPIDKDAQFQQQFINEKVEYKVQTVKTPKTTISVPINNDFNVEYIFKNIGKVKWPEQVEFKCISGLYEGVVEKIVSIQPNDEVRVNIPLEHSIKTDFFQTKWTLQYKDQNDMYKRFGNLHELNINFFNEEEDQNINEQQLQNKIKKIIEIFPAYTRDQISQIVSQNPGLSIDDLINLFY